MEALLERVPSDAVVGQNPVIVSRTASTPSRMISDSGLTLLRISLSMQPPVAGSSGRNRRPDRQVR